MVGRYKHATVWRNLQDRTIMFEDGTEEDRYYNVWAKASDCTLLLSGEWNRAIRSIPSAKRTGVYGFGQSMVWYPTEPEAENYLTRLLKNIESYCDENWINKWSEE